MTTNNTDPPTDRPTPPPTNRIQFSHVDRLTVRKHLTTICLYVFMCFIHSFYMELMPMSCMHSHYHFKIFVGTKNSASQLLIIPMVAMNIVLDWLPPVLDCHFPLCVCSTDMSRHTKSAILEYAMNRKTQSRCLFMMCDLHFGWCGTDKLDVSCKRSRTYVISSIIRALVRARYMSVHLSQRKWNICAMT